MAGVVAHSVNPFLFGTGSWVYLQLVGLRRWRALVVCKRRENRQDFPFEPVHALVDRPLAAQLRERLGRRLSGGVFPFMRRALAEAGARVLHSHFASQGWTDLCLARASGLPHVTSFYGADIWKNSRDERWRGRYAALFEQGALFLVEGNAMRAKVESLGCPPEKIRVQHLGVEVERTALVERRPGPDGLVRVLASGRAVEKKGHELAVRAFALARREWPGMRLSLMILARSPEERARLARLHELVRAERVEDAVDFPPPRPYAEYRRSLDDYHLFLAPSRHAEDGDAEGGAPVSIIDMSATGMPIVAARHCDIPEVAPDGVSGLLFDEGDVEQAAAALLAAVRAPERWAEWGRGGRAHVEREYSLARQVERLEELYDLVSDRPRRPPGESSPASTGAVHDGRLLGCPATMGEREFTAELDEYVVLKLRLTEYRGSERALPPDCELADPALRPRWAGQERRLLKRYFRNWKSPHRGRLAGWRADSPLLVLRAGRLVAGVYLCGANEFDSDPGWGQLHYAFMDPACRGLGIYSVLFREAVQRARAWGLQGLYLNSDRHQLPEVYQRWGATPWKKIAKAPGKRPRNRGLRAIRELLLGRP